MIRIFRKSHQFFILTILIYGLVAIFSVLHTQSAVMFLNHPFKYPFIGGLQYGIMQGVSSYTIFALVSFFIIILSGFYLTKLLIKVQITRRSQFTAIFYFAISVFAFQFSLFSGAIIASQFLLIALERIISSINKRDTSYRFLDAGILIALGSLFYINMLFLLPFILIAQLVLRPANWRELMFCLIGLCLPFLYLVIGAFITDKSIIDSWNGILQWVWLPQVFFPDNSGLKYGIAFYAVFAFIASIFAMGKFGTAKVQIRKLYQILFFLFVNLILIIIIIPSTGMEILYLLAVPISALFSIYFTECRTSFINRLLLVLLLVVPVAVLWIT